MNIYSGLPSFPRIQYLHSDNWKTVSDIASQTWDLFLPFQIYLFLDMGKLTHPMISCSKSFLRYNLNRKICTDGDVLKKVLHKNLSKKLWVMLRSCYRQLMQMIHANLKLLFLGNGWPPNENGKINSAHVRQTSHAAAVCLLVVFSRESSRSPPKDGRWNRKKVFILLWR